MTTTEVSRSAIVLLFRQIRHHRLLSIPSSTGPVFSGVGQGGGEPRVPWPD